MKYRHQLVCFALLSGIFLIWFTMPPELAAQHQATTKHTATIEEHHVAQPMLPKTQSLQKEPSKKPGKETSQIGRFVKYTPPPLPDLGALKFPRTETGGIMLFPVDTGESKGHIELREDLRDPLTTVGGCTRWIVSCVQPGNRSLDDCAKSAPHCATDKPWQEEAHCCPASCFESYASLRTEGIDPIASFDTVYFEDGSCFPGLKDLLSGVSPAPPAAFNQVNKEL